ncbi:hypothetical protein AMJ57_03540 [Parcubacteria bacterium SG8_24]|nr:MAG: hypothetical protein AMJ57_03540 [Parcubacteria bacterium SG8_24]
MTKHWKTALVLLYLVQVAIMFREQILHLFRHAEEAAHREAVLVTLDETETVLKRSPGPGIDPYETLVQVESVDPLAALLGYALHEKREEHHPNHRHDERQDRNRRARRRALYAFVIANLFRTIQRYPRPSGTGLARTMPLQRFLTFGASCPN